MRVPADFGVPDAALTEVALPSDFRKAREIEERILVELQRAGYDPDTNFGVKLALEEAVTNAVKHGNRCDPRKQVIVRYHVGPERVVIMVRDEGRGFRVENVPDPTTDENLERPNGRGIMLMQCYMTKVCFNPAGNEVWLLKERSRR